MSAVIGLIRVSHKIKNDQTQKYKITLVKIGHLFWSADIQIQRLAWWTSSIRPHGSKLMMLDLTFLLWLVHRVYCSPTTWPSESYLFLADLVSTLSCFPANGTCSASFSFSTPTNWPVGRIVSLWTSLKQRFIDHDICPIDQNHHVRTCSSYATQFGCVSSSDTFDSLLKVIEKVISCLLLVSI